MVIMVINVWGGEKWSFIGMDAELLSQLGRHVLWPLTRILFFVSLGLLVANLIESLNWTHHLAVMARPLIGLGHMSAITGASFSMAFFSGVAANTMLAEASNKGDLTKKELVLANLFNSLPRFFLHLPTVFFLTAPFLGAGAFIYVGITFTAALTQTLLVVVLGRLLLPGRSAVAAMPQRQKTGLAEAWTKSLRRLRRRLPRIMKFLVPIYCLFFLVSYWGGFARLQEIMAHLWLFSWLNPQSLAIVVLHVTTEFSAGLAAASALLVSNSLTIKEVVLALLVGNILSSPIRAIRHQLPYYIGIFRPRLAVELVTISQLTRATTIILMGWVYFLVG